MTVGEYNQRTDAIRWLKEELLKDISFADKFNCLAQVKTQTLREVIVCLNDLILERMNREVKL